MAQFDVIIIGGGIGGLVAGALLADAGLSILLLEQHGIVGGCASTFMRRGYNFDSGATLGFGFHKEGPMQWLAEQLDLQWPVINQPVAWEYNSEHICIPLTADRGQLIQTFPDSREFWEKQKSISGRLWYLTGALLDQYRKSRTEQLSSLAQLLFSQCITPDLVRHAAGSAAKWLERHTLQGDLNFRRFIDAQLLVSAQTTSKHSNALFAALALDLPRKSPCTLVGGMGSVARILSEAIQQRGGRVHLNEKVLHLIVQNKHIDKVVTKQGIYTCRQVLCNGSSAVLAPLLGKVVPGSWRKLNRSRWGAFILHLGIDENVFTGRSSRYLQLSRPGVSSLAEGGSLFLSASDPGDASRAPAGKSAVTVSTHTEVDQWWQALKVDRKSYEGMKKEYTDRIISTMAHYLGDCRGSINLCLAGTPVTYARYTGRHLGLVGGYAQTGLFAPRQERYGLKNITFVGDHRFPGQSITGVTVGAAMVADILLRRI